MRWLREYLREWRWKREMRLGIVYLRFAHYPFEVGDIMEANGTRLRVVRVYKPTWYRRLRRWLGIQTRMSGLKAKIITEQILQ